MGLGVRRCSAGFLEPALDFLSASSFDVSNKMFIFGFNLLRGGSPLGAEMLALPLPPSPASES